MNVLTELPLEVRFMVYDLLIPPQTTLFCRTDAAGRPCWFHDGSDAEEEERGKGLRAMLSLARTCRSLYAAFPRPTLEAVTDLPGRSQECLALLYRRITFYFDQPSTARTFFQQVPRNSLKGIQGIHVNYGHHSEENSAVVLQLMEANPCGLHLCGMENVLDKATRTKMLPPSQVALQD